MISYREILIFGVFVSSSSVVSSVSIYVFGFYTFYACFAGRVVQNLLVSSLFLTLTYLHSIKFPFEMKVDICILVA